MKCAREIVLDFLRLDKKLSFWEKMSNLAHELPAEFYVGMDEGLQFYDDECFLYDDRHLKVSASARALMKIAAMGKYPGDVTKQLQYMLGIETRILKRILSGQ